MDTVIKINSFINEIVWGPFMLCILLGVGIFYSFKMHFFQIRHFKLWWKMTFCSIFTQTGSKNSNNRLSPFRAMATALAGAIGTGNIVGVAGAISLGGAGAVFWMWAAAVFGMSTIFAENVLGVRYREVRNGCFVGGPMYYIEKGLHCKWGAVIFAILCTFAALGMGNMTQANSVSGALKSGFDISPQISGIVIAAAAAFVIFGGIGRISALTEKLVPFMALLYILAAFIVLAVNFKKIPGAFAEIICGAFDLRLGSSPIVHAAADTDDPYTQGMWGIFQVFIDTIVLCTLMALCILTTDSDICEQDSIILSTEAFSSVLGNTGKIFISVSIVLFAFATLVSWCYFGEKSFEYLSKGRFIVLYRVIYIASSYIGCIMSLSLVWDISDTLNGLMALPNLAALILLSNKIRYSELSTRLK